MAILAEARATPSGVRYTGIRGSPGKDGSDVLDVYEGIYAVVEARQGEWSPLAGLTAFSGGVHLRLVDGRARVLDAELVKLLQQQVP